MQHFIKNVHFTKLVKAADRLREFNFRKTSGMADDTFYVDVPDDRGNRIMFRMHKEDNNYWKIMDEPVPRWISDTEGSLNQVISEELS